MILNYKKYSLIISSSRKKSGFTFVELLIGITISAISIAAGASLISSNIARRKVLKIKQSYLSVESDLNAYAMLIASSYLNTVAKQFACSPLNRPLNQAWLKSKETISSPSVGATLTNGADVYLLDNSSRAFLSASGQILDPAKAPAATDSSNFAEAYRRCNGLVPASGVGTAPKTFYATTNTGVFPDNLAASATGFRLCVTLLPSGQSTPGDAGKNFSRFQPNLIEFVYVPMDVSNGTALKCESLSDVNLTKYLVGTLYFKAFWFGVDSRGNKIDGEQSGQFVSANAASN